MSRMVPTERSQKSMSPHWIYLKREEMLCSGSSDDPEDYLRQPGVNIWWWNAIFEKWYVPFGFFLRVSETPRLNLVECTPEKAFEWKHRYVGPCHYYGESPGL